MSASSSIRANSLWNVSPMAHFPPTRPFVYSDRWDGADLSWRVLMSKPVGMLGLTLGTQARYEDRSRCNSTLLKSS